jgi:tRNA threonylcarbamoyladenosine modification (KEOPS) complex Cgi121 subunit
MQIGRYFLEMVSFTSSGRPAEEISQLLSMTSSELVQSFDSSVYRGPWHLRLIASQTLSALETGQLLGRSTGVDFLLRMAGTDQIRAALEISGVKPNKRAYLVVAGKQNRVRKDIGKSLGMLRSARRVQIPANARYEESLIAESSALLGLKKFRADAVSDR